MIARTTALVSLCGLIAIGGCTTWQPGQPDARREEPKDSTPDDPPMVVQDDPPAEEDAPPDPTDQRILDYVRNIDGVGRRVNDQHNTSSSAGPGSAVAPPANLASDKRPPVRFEPAPDTDSTPSGTPAGALPAATQPAAPGPPVLSKVDARAEHPSEYALAADRSVTPTVNAPAAACAPPASIKEFANRWGGQSDDTSFQRQLDARLLHVAAGNYERARQPLELVSDEQQQLAAGFIDTYILIRERKLGDDPTQTANAALERIEQLADALHPLSEPTIPTLALCQAVSGYGQYRTLDPPEFPSGVPIEFVTYCEVGNFTSQAQTDGTFQARFDMFTTVLSRDGAVIREIVDRDIVDHCHSRRHDCFIPRLVRLPGTLSPGQYVVKVKILDKLAGKLAAECASFRVIADP